MKPATRFLLAIIGSAAWLGLAILGWGGFGPYFADQPRVALAVVMAIIAVVAFFAGGNISPGVREDRSNRWVIYAFTLIGLFVGYLPAYTERREFWTFDGELIRWLGVVLFAGGCMLRLWPVFVLGNRFSGLVAIQPDHKLVTTGIYRFIRNPSYLGLLTSSLGWSLSFRSGVGLLLTALLIPPLVSRMHAEERLLREHFGDAYDAYCARTSRLIPWIY